jgi:hypothetical protein
MHRLLVFVLVAVAAPFAAAAAQAYTVEPINTDACPGFAQTYPADYLFSGNSDVGFMPPGAYLAPGDDQGAVTLGPAGRPGSGRVTITVSGLTAPGEAFNDSLGLPDLTDFAAFSYTIEGTFTTPRGDPPGFIHGLGQLRIVRSDGARMWGQGGVVLLPHASGEWHFGFAPSPHCRVRGR